MVDVYPAVAHLTAALDRAETTARAATPGPWFASPYDDDWDGTGHEASIGTRPNDTRWPDGATDVVGHGYEGGGVCKLADADHIAAWGPNVVLRQVAAVRAVLDAHSPTAGCGYLPYVPGRPLADGYGTIDPACTTCGTDNEYAVPWPCATVLTLAEGWGWEGAR